MVPKQSRKPVKAVEEANRVPVVLKSQDKVVEVKITVQVAPNEQTGKTQAGGLSQSLLLLKTSLVTHHVIIQKAGEHQKTSFHPQDDGKRSNMHLSIKNQIDKTYPVCRSLMDPAMWDRIVAPCSRTEAISSFDMILASEISGLGLPLFLPELARLEYAVSMIASGTVTIPPSVDQLEINPTVHLFEFSWRGLAALMPCSDAVSLTSTCTGNERILVLLHPKTGDVMIRPATDEDLLVLKMVVEALDPRDVAMAGEISIGAVNWALDRAVDAGLVLAPRSLIRRDPDSFPGGTIRDETFFESPFFTIQWHITQACDLQCKHCYDRSRRSPVKRDQAFRILDDLLSFCKSRHVLGQVSFTGGNPFLHPHFFDFYRAAVDRGFVTAVLGNPTAREKIGRIVEIQKPAYFQVSLEGLREHNDFIRGEGNFDSVITFLGVLREFGIPSQVMLTLTRNNLDQVIPLAEILRDSADSFTFNRLAQVGEAVDMLLPSPGDYRTFLNEYLTAAERNPVMGVKDNLFNIIYYQHEKNFFGGCAGYGCSAAFNFIAVLPDGEAHACRKFPSLIGNVFEQSIADIYDSESARRYRSGTRACRSCPIRPVCGGCLAVVYGQGLDIFTARDPFCFMEFDGMQPLPE